MASTLIAKLRARCIFNSAIRAPHRYIRQGQLNGMFVSLNAGEDHQPVSQLNAEQGIKRRVPWSSD